MKFLPNIPVPFYVRSFHEFQRHAFSEAQISITLHILGPDVGPFLLHTASRVLSVDGNL